MKKILIGLGIIIILVIIGGFAAVKYMTSKFDQIALQYDNEVKPELKRALDFSTYEDSINSLTDQRLQELSDLILNKEIKELQSSLNSDAFTYEELVAFYAKRIQDYDGAYNSIIQLNPKAIEQAKALDKKRKSGNDLGDLYGVVVLLKDNISAVDMNTSAGAYALKDLTTNRDAFIVATLKDQDAIILGKSNLSEWSNFMSVPSSSGFSVLGGQTKNAYGRYDVGGSSSGPAAAASLDFATITLGSETAGSMIFPAGQNGVVGLKPTLGLLSRDLIIPISEAQDTAGIMGKSVADVWSVFKTMLAEDPADPLSTHVAGFDRAELDKSLTADYLKGKRLGMVKSTNEKSEQLKKELIELGAEVIEIEPSKTSIDYIKILNYGMVNDVALYLNNKDVNTSFKSLQQILDYNKEDAANRMPFGAGLWDGALKQEMTAEDYEALVESNRKTGQNIIDTWMKENNVEALVSFSNELSGIYAPAMYPAFTVPVGYKESGEPVGVTFVGSLNDDAKLMMIGYSYEQGTMHRVAPSLQK